MSEHALPVLGWKEHAALPDWGVRRLRVKLDTGARSSALHVESYTVVDEHEHEGQPLPVVRLELLVGSRDDPNSHHITERVVGYKKVRDTGAKSELRPVVRTRIVCGPVDTTADITITDRTGMNFRMLLGRLTLQGHCLVDPARGYLHSPRPPRRDSGTPS